MRRVHQPTPRQAERTLPPVRSALFVPAIRRDLLDKALRTGADALIADLEDSVADARKDEACAVLLGWLDDLGDDAPVVVVRINGLGEDRLPADLGVCVHPRVTAVMVPKIETSDDVITVDGALSVHEQLSGREVGSTLIWPIVETARAVRLAFDIATSSRRIVAFMGGSAGDAGDLAASVGFEWTEEFTETLFIRSKVLVDVRAAGLANPISGVVTDLRSLDQVERFAVQSRRLGYEGMMVIHPSHVAVVNRIFSPSDERVAWARGVLGALAEAERQGSAAIRFDGMMVDVAMAAWARRVLAAAERNVA
jgi:citrate lyase subunit beta / citryl-CoA lyase